MTQQEINRKNGLMFYMVGPFYLLGMTAVILLATLISLGVDTTLELVGKQMWWYQTLFFFVLFALYRYMSQSSGNRKN